MFLFPADVSPSNAALIETKACILRSVLHCAAGHFPYCPTFRRYSARLSLSTRGITSAPAGPASPTLRSG